MENHDLVNIYKGWDAKNNKEINNAMVTKVINIINNARVLDTEDIGFLSVVMGNRLYIVYLKGVVHAC